MMDLILVGLFALYLGKNFDFDFSQNQPDYGLPTYSDGRAEWKIVEDGIKKTNPDTKIEYSAHLVRKIAYDPDTGEEVEMPQITGAILADSKFMTFIRTSPNTTGGRIASVNYEVEQLAKGQAQRDADAEAERRRQEELDEAKRRQREEEEAAQRAEEDRPAAEEEKRREREERERQQAQDLAELYQDRKKGGSRHGNL